MSMFNSLKISASGLTSQSMRMDVISENIANVNTTRTESGDAYKRKVPIFEEVGGNSFSSFFSRASMKDSGGGVKVSEISVDNSEGLQVYDPEHPDANGDGFVQMPNVNIVEEMVNMISASRSYEANITAMNSTKSMLAKTLQISQ